jgi:hypothetical protein
MPCGFGQALDICRKALYLWAWRSLFTHRTILAKLFLYNTVVKLGLAGSLSKTTQGGIGRVSTPTLLPTQRVRPLAQPTDIRLRGRI